MNQEQQIENIISCLNQAIGLMHSFASVARIQARLGIKTEENETYAREINTKCSFFIAAIQNYRAQQQLETQSHCGEDAEKTKKGIDSGPKP